MGKIAIYEEAATPATPTQGVILYPTVATPSILRLIDDAGNDRAIATPYTGTWTPTIRGSSTAGSHTYSVQVGRYTRIGTIAICAFEIQINTKDGAMAGNAQIAGLPFAFKNVSSFYQAGSLAYWISLGSSVIWLGLFGTINATTCELTKTTAAATGVSNMAAADIANGTALIGSIAYEAEA